MKSGRIFTQQQSGEIKLILCHHPPTCQKIKKIIIILLSSIYTQADLNNAQSQHLQKKTKRTNIYYLTLLSYYNRSMCPLSYGCMREVGKHERSVTVTQDDDRV